MEYTYPDKQTNPELLKEQINAALGYAALFDAKNNGRTGEYYVYFPDITEGERDLIIPVIDAHDYTQQSQGQIDDEARRAAIADALDRLNLNALRGKTPAQIYAAIQGQIDGWTSLADAQDDLREWIPLIASAVYWLIKL